MMNHLLNEEQFPAGFLPAWFEARHRQALEQAGQLPEPSRLAFRNSRQRIPGKL